MKKEQNLCLLNVVINGLATLIWIANVVVRIALTDSPPLLILLNGICALCFGVAFVLHLCRYRNLRKQQ